MKSILLMVGLMLMIGTASGTVTFTSNQIQISNGAENCTTINSSLSDQSKFQDLAGNEWLSHYPIIVQSTGTFYVNNTDCGWLKLLSLNDGNPAYIENLGILNMANTKVTSWDNGTNTVAPKTDSTRPYIYSHGVQLLAESCNLSYLGYTSPYLHGIHLYQGSIGSEIKNSTMIGNNRGLSIDEDGVRVINCEIHSSGVSYSTSEYFGIAIAYRANPISNLYFDNVTVHDNYGMNFMCQYCKETGSMIDSILDGVVSYNGKGNLITLRTTRNLTVRNCIAHTSGFDNDNHSGIDFHSFCDNITADNCTAYSCQNAFYIHNIDTNITITNSTAYGADGGFKIMGGCTNNRIENCTAYNINGGAFVTASSSDNEVINCTGYDSTYGAFFFPYNWTGGIMPWTEAYYNENNTYDGCNFTGNGGTYKFYTPGPGITYRGANYIYNQVEETVTWTVGGAPTLKYMYEDGTVFKTGSTYIPCYINGSYKEWDVAAADTITAYNITLIPNSNQLQNLTVNHDSHIGDDRTNISINSSAAENSAWINATMQNGNHVYNISRDNVYYNQVSSDSDGVVRYQYTIAGDEWGTPHDFEFTWHSTGVCAAEGNADITQIGDIIYVYGAEKSCNMEYLYQQVANSTALSKSGSTYFANASIYVNGSTTTLNINDVCCDWLKLNSTNGDIAYLRFDGYGEIDDTKITSWNTSISNYDNRSNESQARAYIYFANGKGNITDSELYYLGYNAAYHYGVHLVSATSSLSAIGNTIKYGYDGITFINSNGATLSGNTINNSGWHGTYLQGSDNCIVYNNKYNNNDYGIFIHAGSDNNDVTYNSLDGDEYGLTTWSSAYNNLSYNTINGTINGGLRFYQASNNTAIGNNVTYCGYGLSLHDACYNNTISGGNIYGSGTYDYYNWFTNNDSVNDNYVVNTNFTAARKISFGGSLAKSSRFNYSDLASEDLWLVTNVTAASYNYTTRSLTSFSQDDISWTETWDAPISVNYEVTGLTPTYEYSIYNGSIESTQSTDASGKLEFNIDFSTSGREIQVLYFNTNYSLSYFNSSNPILITSKLDGINIFNRTVTKQDTEITDFKMVVSTA